MKYFCKVYYNRCSLLLPMFGSMFNVCTFFSGVLGCKVVNDFRLIPVHIQDE